MLTLTATVLNVFPTTEFVDKMTGDVTPAGHKAQLQYMASVPAGGQKVVLKDFNIRGDGDKFKVCIGKVVSVEVGQYIDQKSNKGELFIPKGSLPTVLNQQPVKAAA